MLLVVALKTLFIGVVAVVLFAPVVAWLARRQSALLHERPDANRADGSSAAFTGLLHPGADFREFVTREEAFPPGEKRFLRAVAAILASIPALVAFAVIPYGGSYELGGMRLSLVAADVDWGVLYVLAVAAFASYGALLASWTRDDDRAMLAAARTVALRVSYSIAIGLSLVGSFAVYGSLKLSDMALAQDASLPVFGFLEWFGWLPALPAPLEWVRLPSWGIVLQPLGFVMFLAGSLAANGRPPFDRLEGGSDSVSSSSVSSSSVSSDSAGASGAHFGLFYVSEFVQVVVIAGLCTAIFLGGWSLPYLSQTTLLGALGPLLGEAAATAVCMLLHVASFFLKVVGMVWLQMRIRYSLPRIRYERAMDLCWKWLLPVSALNAFVTAAVLLTSGLLPGLP